MFQIIFQHLFIPCLYLQKDLKKCLQQKFVTYDPFKAGICPSSWLVSWKEAPKIVHLFPGLKSLVSKKKEGRNPTTILWGLFPKNGGNSTGNICKTCHLNNGFYFWTAFHIVNGGWKSETTLPILESFSGTWVDSLLKLSAGYCTVFFSLSARLPSRELTYPTPRHVWVDDFPFPKVGRNVIVPRRVFSCVFSTSLIVEDRSHHHLWQISLCYIMGI